MVLYVSAARCGGRSRWVVRTTLLIRLITAAYRLGVSPKRLARWYGGKERWLITGSTLVSSNSAIPASMTEFLSEMKFDMVETAIEQRSEHGT